MPMTLMKTLVWTGKESILGVRSLIKNKTTTRIAVLSAEDLT